MSILAFGVGSNIEWEVGIGDQERTRDLGRRYLARLFQEIGEYSFLYHKWPIHPNYS
jgi:hypothetical protein